MSDPTEEPTVPQLPTVPFVQLPTLDDFTPADWLFEFLLDLAAGDDEQGSVSLAVVVSTGGKLISGELISLGAFRDLLVEAINPGSKELAQGFKDMIDGKLKESADADVEREKNEEPKFARRYFHLKNAVIFESGIQTNIGLWRGQLAHVAGWTTGQLSKSD